MIMSIDLTIVSLERPDLVACTRLAQLILSVVQPPVEFSGFDADEIPFGYHEFGARHVTMLSVTRREDEVYLAMLVVAQSIASLYEGEIVDEVSFFPRVGILETFHVCIENGCHGASFVWQLLGPDPPTGGRSLCSRR